MSLVSEVTSTPLSGLNHIDALLDDGPGWNWLKPARNAIYYSFSVASGNQVDNYNISGGVTAFNAAQKNACLNQLSYISQLTGITFTEAASGTAADIHFAATNIVFSSSSSGLCSWNSSYSYDGSGVVQSYSADAYIYLDQVEWAGENQAPSPGNYGYETLLHELGHALGLKHPFEDTTRLPTAEDNTSNSVMSYTDSGGPYSTFSPYDVAALMWIYGGDGLGGAYGVSTDGKYLVGTGAGNQLSGGNGNDQLQGLAGNDSINGGAGDDIAVYSGNRANYTVTATASGFAVSSTADGADTLTNVEYAQFSDQKLELAMAATDTTAPTISAFSPTDEATGVAIGSNIVVTFSEAVARGAGNILLKNAAGTTIATYDAATSNNLAISGSTLTINPSADLTNSTDYRVEFAAGSIKDIAGNSFAGTTAYNFTTVASEDFIPKTIAEVETRFSEPLAPRKNYFFLSMQAQANDLTAYFSTVDSGNSALAGQDYISTNTTVTIPAGTTSFTFGVDILSNNYAESEESFSCTVVLDIANQPSIELLATHTIEAHTGW